jgi:hypothetical protein
MISAWAGEADEASDREGSVAQPGAVDLLDGLRDALDPKE